MALKRNSEFLVLENGSWNVITDDTLAVTAHGICRIKEQDGDTVIYGAFGRDDCDQMGTLGEDVFRVTEMTNEQFIAALPKLTGWQNGSRTEPTYRLYTYTEFSMAGRSTTTRNHRYITVFANRLSSTMLKQGGKVVHYLPVTQGQALKLSNGTAKITYTKGGNRAQVVSQ